MTQRITVVTGGPEALIQRPRELNKPIAEQSERTRSPAVRSLPPHSFNALPVAAIDLRLR